MNLNHLHQQQVFLTVEQFFFTLCVYVCVHARVRMHMCEDPCVYMCMNVRPPMPYPEFRGLEDSFGEKFSSTKWVLGIKLVSSGMAASSFTTEPPPQP